MTEGSYSHPGIYDQDAEVERLHGQAHVVEDIEAGILQEAGIKTKARVVEIGCGPGYITNLLSRLSPDGTILSADYAYTLVSQVRTNVSRPPLNGLHPVCAKGDSLPLKESWADFCYSRFLLQHVPDPDAIVKEAFRVLSPKGIFCVTDSDDGLIIHYPQDKRLANLLETAQSVQAEKGGDRFIGRKIPQMLSSAGFQNIKSRVITLTNSQLPFDILFNILFGYKATLTGKMDEVKNVYSELKAECEAGKYFLSAGVFVVSGQK